MKTTHILIGCFVLSIIAFQGHINAQTVHDGVRWLQDADWDIHTSTGMYAREGLNSDEGIAQAPLSFRLVIRPDAALKGELAASLIHYFRDLKNGEYGSGASFTVGLRYDFALTDDIYVGVKSGYQILRSRYQQAEYQEFRPGFYFDFMQEYNLAKSLDVVLSEGFVVIPARDKLIPTVMLGLRIANVFTLGVDVSSFWLSAENNFVKSRTMF